MDREWLFSSTLIYLKRLLELFVLESGGRYGEQVHFGHGAAEAVSISESVEFTDNSFLITEG